MASHPTTAVTVLDRPRAGIPLPAARTPRGEPKSPAAKVWDLAQCVNQTCGYLAWYQGLCGVHAPPEEKPRRLCDITGCNRVHFGRGLCHMHYQRLRKWGTVGDRPRYHRSRRRRDLDRAAAIADAQQWAEAIWSAALVNLDGGRA